MSNTKEWHRQINGKSYTDLLGIFESMKEHPVHKRLRVFMKMSGVDFYDDENYFIKTPSISIVGVGGIPVRLESVEEGKISLAGQTLLPETVFDSFKDMHSVGAFMSYLNSGDKNSKEMQEILAKFGHQSTKHMTYLNILISGISTAVENEFNCQRDLVHLSRITVARTSVQDDPPIVVPHESFLPLITTIRKQTKETLDSFTDELPEEITQKDRREAMNNLFPTLKGTTIILSGSLRNLAKVAQFKDDEGKEKEYRGVLARLDDLLKI